MVVVGQADRKELPTNIEWSRTFKPLAADELETLLARRKPLADECGKSHGQVA